MHGPEILRGLLARAIRSLRGGNGVRVPQLRQREVAINLNNFASGYVRFIQKRARLLFVTGAERSLEVRKIDQLHRRFWISAIEVAVGVHANR
jgi:hypothetical protein